jgi:hypothetical protein
MDQSMSSFTGRAVQTRREREVSLKMYFHIVLHRLLPAGSDSPHSLILSGITLCSPENTRARKRAANWSGLLTLNSRGRLWDGRSRCFPPYIFFMVG